MNWMDESENAYKNGYRCGYEQGYGEGMKLGAEELVNKVIRWHKRVPNHDIAHCFVVYRLDDDNIKVYMASYSSSDNMFYQIESVGTVGPSDKEFVMWGEYRPVKYIIAKTED